MKICLYDRHYKLIWAYTMGNQKTSYQLIAITIGLILFSGSISGTMPVVFAEHVDFGEIKAKAGKAKKEKKCKEEQKYEGICDKKDPKIKIISPGKKDKVSGEPLMVTVEATDNGSGIDKVEVRLDKGPFLEATLISPDTYKITFPDDVDDGKHKITAKATDKVGNDKRKSVKFIVES